MTSQKDRSPAGETVSLPEASAGDNARVSIDELLNQADAPQPLAQSTGASNVAMGIRSARLLDVIGRRASISFRNSVSPLEIDIAQDVEIDLLKDALRQGDSVLVEFVPGEEPVVVGVLQTRRPRELHLRASSITIEGDNEVLLRSGRGALRIREDGDVELVGSRISAASRGLFRIVGRLLRLN